MLAVEKLEENSSEYYLLEFFEIKLFSKYFTNSNQLKSYLIGFNKVSSDNSFEKILISKGEVLLRVKISLKNWFFSTY